jgi:hypothetical protein
VGPSKVGGTTRDILTGTLPGDPVEPRSTIVTPPRAALGAPSRPRARHVARPSSHAARRADPKWGPVWQSVREVHAVYRDRELTPDTPRDLQSADDGDDANPSDPTNEARRCSAQPACWPQLS